MESDKPGTEQYGMPQQMTKPSTNIFVPIARLDEEIGYDYDADDARGRL
jgi:hypothetical protein